MKGSALSYSLSYAVLQSRSRLRLAVAALACATLLPLVPATAQARQEKPWEKIPVPPLHVFEPQQPKRIELANGIVLFLQEDHELPFVSGSVLIPGGSRDEVPAKAGLTALYGQTWRLSGTVKLSGDQLDDRLEARAAHIETSGGESSTSLAWDSLTADSNEVFDLAMDLLFHPRFRADKLALARQQLAAGILRRNDQEGEIAEREAAKLVYGPGSPYTREPELATIAAVTVADLERLHEQSLGGRLIVSLHGDFDPVALEARLRAVFAPQAAARRAPVRTEHFAEPKQSLNFVEKANVNQSVIEIVGLGLERRNPDVPTVAVMNEILGGGFASRLFQRVRTERGLAYSVGGGFGAAWDHPSLFHVSALTKSASTVEATRLCLEEIAGLRTRPFTVEELARSRENLLNSFLFRYDTPEKVLAERVRLEFYGYPPDYLERYRVAIERVSLADLTAAAQRYVHPDRLAVLVVGHGAEIHPNLSELGLGPVHAVDITIPGAAAVQPAP